MIYTIRAEEAEKMGKKIVLIANQIIARKKALRGANNSRISPTKSDYNTLF
jgi:hypothetical protein